MPGTVYDHCDGLWSDEPGRAMLLLTADCLPIAIARRGGCRRWAILHAGWRGLLAGIVAAGVRALGGAGLAAVIGPSIGPCCYEVGDEVALPFREAFGDDVVPTASSTSGRAPSARSARQASSTSTRLDLCTVLRSRALLLAPPRSRPHRPAGSDGVRRLTPARSASATSASAPRSVPA